MTRTLELDFESFGLSLDKNAMIKHTKKHFVLVVLHLTIEEIWVYSTSIVLNNAMKIVNVNPPTGEEAEEVPGTLTANHQLPAI